MSEITLIIDGKTLKAGEGDTLLRVALAHGIYIPNLCAIREATEPAASCRLCFVEVEGRQEPVTACTEPAREGTVIHTRGAGALKLARTSAELLLSNHALECGTCLKNRSCELIRIARHLGIKLRNPRFRRLEGSLPLDDSLPSFVYDPNKCVLCGRCIWICRERLGVGAIGFTRRGIQRRVSTFENRPLAQSGCNQCGECVQVCPVGALTFRDRPLEPTEVVHPREG
jgi:bidirectional [NiFe] hydrogenase diaphorase subunit